MFAAKAYDIVMGVDIHIIQPPGPVPPIPIPHPFIGMILDPMDFVPMVGATVYVNNMPRAQAGTAAKDIPPHIPIGGVFVKPPANEGEMFMGSATVNVEGAPFSFMANPVLSCHDIGMPPPPRPKKKGAPKSMFLPTTVVMPIPAGMPVLIGGPPTIDMMAMAMKFGMAAFGKLAKKAKAALKKAAKGKGKFAKAVQKAKKVINGAKEKLQSLKCKLGLEPVNFADGSVVATSLDFELPGPIPLKWERFYASNTVFIGELGQGWVHPYDMTIELMPDEAAAVISLPEGRLVGVPLLVAGESYFERAEKMTFGKDGQGFYFRDENNLVHRFQNFDSADPNMLYLTSVENLNKAAIHFQRDSKGRLNRIIDSAGRVLNVFLDEAGRIVAIDAPHPDKEGERFPLVRYVYDGNGNLARAYDANDHTPQYFYQNNLLTKYITNTGTTFYWEYDGDGPEARCIHSWGDGGLMEGWLEYFPEEGKTIVRFGEGAVHTYFHENGVVTKEIDSNGGVVVRKYNEYQEVVSETDQMGMTTIFEYDDFGNQTLKVAPDGAAVQLQYNEFGLITGATDPNGGSWSWGYDENGNLLSRTDAAGETTNYTWVNGYLTEITDALGGKTVLGYDNKGNLNMAISPDQQASWWSYDAMGRCVEAVDPKGNRKRWKFDLKGNTIEVAEPDGNIRHLKYDGDDNITHARDNQHDISFQYSPLGNMQARTEGGTRVEFRYDKDGRLTAIQNEHGSVYKFELDKEGNVVAEYGFDGLTRRYVRDLAGKVVEVQRPGDRQTFYEYDGAGRVVKVSHSDGSSETFTYRADGELVGAKNDAIAVSFERDAIGRVIKEMQGGFVVESGFDILGRRMSVKSTLGANIDFARNLMGDVEQVSMNNWNAQFRRDNLGLELSREMTGGVTSHWRRDRLGRPVQQEIMSGGMSRRTRNYTWDVNDRLRQLMDSQKGMTTFGHDVFGNLASAQNADGSTDFRMPDAVGNLFRSKDRSDRKYGPAGQLLQANGTRYEYDPEGNLVRKIQPNGKNWQYEWNAAGMLSRVVRPDGDIVTFTYDALGRRISKTFKGKTTRWVWDGNVPLHEWVEPGTVPQPTSVETAGGMTPDEAEKQILLASSPDLVTWVFEPESFSPMAKLTANRQCGIVTDHLGTPLTMFDQTGKSVWSADLNIYGERTQYAGQADDCPFRFPGQYEDVETGLYYNRFRYYDAEGGFYVSQDPIRILGGFELYKYVKDVNSWTDIYGLAPCWSATHNKSSTKNAFGHWKKHGKEFPEYKNSVQYVKGANDFVKKPPSGTLMKTKPNGDKVFYHPPTNTFAVQNSAGSPKTMFRPDPSKHGHATNLDYFNAQ
ncbi:MAG: DUF6531 domain-containing protein [Saprospiraceae bacterium]